MYTGMSSASNAIVNGRFEVQDTETNKSGVLQVCMDGISLFLDKTKVNTFYHFTPLFLLNS